MTLTVNCPQCKKPVEWIEANTYRPFCCHRCKLIDLGEWAEESHKISEPATTELELNEEMLDALEAQFI